MQNVPFIYHRHKFIQFIVNISSQQFLTTPIAPLFT